MTQSLHRDLWVLDLTSDLTIPTFAAVSRRNDAEVEDLTLGFGAHFDARLAIQRALTEMNQWLPVVCSGSTENGVTYRSQDREAIQWWETATLANQPYLAPDQAAVSKSREDYSSNWHDDVAVDVITCVDIAKEKGLEALILDQSTGYRASRGEGDCPWITPCLAPLWSWPIIRGSCTDGLVKGIFDRGAA